MVLLPPEVPVLAGIDELDADGKALAPLETRPVTIERTPRIRAIAAGSAVAPL